MSEIILKREDYPELYDAVKKAYGSGTKCVADFVLPAMEEKSVEAAKLDHKIDYLERIEALEKEVARMTEQATSFRDLARSHTALLLQAAERLEKRCHPRTLKESKLIAELREAAKD